MEATIFDGPIWMQVIRARGFFEEAIQRSYTARGDGLLGHRMVYNWSESAFAEPSTQLPTTATRHCCSSRSTTPTTTRWWPVPSTRSSHTFAISGMRPPERLRRKLPRTHRKSPKTSLVLRRTLRRKHCIISEVIRKLPRKRWPIFSVYPSVPLSTNCAPQAGGVYTTRWAGQRRPIDCDEQGATRWLGARRRATPQRLASSSRYGPLPTSCAATWMRRSTRTWFRGVSSSSTSPTYSNSDISVERQIAEWGERRLLDVMASPPGCGACGFQSALGPRTRGRLAVAPSR